MDKITAILGAKATKDDNPRKKTAKEGTNKVNKVISKKHFGHQFFIKEIEPYNFLEWNKAKGHTGWPSFRSVHSTFAKLPQMIFKPPESVLESQARKLVKFLRITLETGHDKMDLPEDPRSPIVLEKEIQYISNVPNEIMDMYGRPFFVTNAKDLRSPNTCNAKTEYDLNVQYFLASRLQLGDPFDPNSESRILSALLDDVITVECSHAGCGKMYMTNPTRVPESHRLVDLTPHPVGKVKKGNLMSILYPSPNQWLDISNNDKKEEAHMYEVAPTNTELPNTEEMRCKHLEVLTKTWMYKNDHLVFFKKHFTENGHEYESSWYRYSVKLVDGKLPRKIIPKKVTVESFQECLHWLVQYYRLLNLIGTVRAIPLDQQIPAEHRLHNAKEKPVMFATMPVVISKETEPLMKKYSLAALQTMVNTPRAVETDGPKIVTVDRNLKAPYNNWQVRYMRDSFFDHKGVPKPSANPYTTWYCNSESDETAVDPTKITLARIQDNCFPQKRMPEAYHMNFMLKDVAETHEVLMRILEEKWFNEESSEEESGGEETEDLSDITRGQEMIAGEQEEHEREYRALRVSTDIAQPIKKLAFEYKTEVKKALQAFQRMNWTDKKAYKRGLFLLMSVTQKNRMTFIEMAKDMQKSEAITLDVIPEKWRKELAPVAIVYDAARLAWYGSRIADMNYVSAFCPTSFITPDKSCSELIRIVLDMEGKLIVSGLSAGEEETFLQTSQQLVSLPVEMTSKYTNILLSALLLFDRLSDDVQTHVKNSTAKRRSLKEVEALSEAISHATLLDLPISALELNNWNPHANAFKFLFETVPEILMRPSGDQDQVRATVQDRRQQTTVIVDSQVNPLQTQQQKEQSIVVTALHMPQPRLTQSPSQTQNTTPPTTTRRFTGSQNQHSPTTTRRFTGSQNQQTAGASSFLMDETNSDSMNIYKTFAAKFEIEAAVAKNGWGSNLTENNKLFFRQVIHPAVFNNKLLETSGEENDPVVTRSYFLENMLQLQRSWEKNSLKSQWMLAPRFIQAAMKNRVEQSRLISRTMRGFLSAPSIPQEEMVVAYPTNGDVESSETLFTEVPLSELPPVPTIVVNTARFLENQEMFSSMKRMLRAFWKPALRNNRPMYEYMKENNLYLADWFMIDDLHGFFMDALDYSALRPTSKVKVFHLLLMVKNFSKVLRYYREPIQTKTEEIQMQWEKDDRDLSSDSSQENYAFEIDEFNTQMFI